MVIFGVLLAVLAQTEDAGMSPDAGRVAPANETMVLGQRQADVRRIAGSAQVVGFEELQRRAQTDVHRVLEGVSGVYVREEDGFGLRPNIGMRGVSSDRSAKITLAEDGVLIAPAPYAAPQAYAFPAMARMTSIEVYKGPASIRFGPSSIGGALNFRSRDIPQGSLGMLDIAAGNFGAVKLHGVLGYGADRLGGLIDIVNESNGGFKVTDGGGSNGFSRFEGMAKLRYVLSNEGPIRQSLSAKFVYNRQRDQESYLGLSNADFAQNPYRRYASVADDNFQSERTQVQLNHELLLGNQFKLSTTVSRSDFGRVWQRFVSFEDGPNPFDAISLLPSDNRFLSALRSGALQSNPVTLFQTRNDFRFVAQSIQTQLSWATVFGELKNELEAGLRYHHDQADRRPSAQPYRLNDANQIQYLGDLTPGPQIREFARAFSLWVQDTVTYKRLVVSPGFRLERYDVFESLNTLKQAQYAVPLFGLGAVYQFDLGLSVLGGVYQGTSPVGPGQDPKVRPEAALNSELGLRYARKGIRAELIGFWSEYSNITGECSTSTGCLGDALNVQFNGGRARTLGLETSLLYRRPLFAGLTLTMQGAYTFTQARFLSSFSSNDPINPIWGAVQSGDELPYVPVHQFNGRVMLERGGLQAEFGVTHIGALRELAGQGDIAAEFKVPGRWLLNANVSYSPTERMTFYASATNLGNRSDLVSRRPFGARPQAPLLAQVGLRLTFL